MIYLSLMGSRVAPNQLISKHITHFPGAKPSLNSKTFVTQLLRNPTYLRGTLTNDAKHVVTNT